MSSVSKVQSSDLVVTNQVGQLYIKENVLASVAMQQLRMLGLEMETALAGCTDQKVRDYIVKYEKKIESLLVFSSLELGNQNLARYKEQFLADEVFTRMKGMIEKGERLQQVIEKTFQSKIDRINQEFPVQLVNYIEQTIQQLMEALGEKETVCKEQSDYFLKKFLAMEDFLNKTSQTIPTYSLYGESCKLMATQEAEFSQRKRELADQLHTLVKPEGLIKEIRKKIDEALKKIQSNKETAMRRLSDEMARCTIECEKLHQFEGYVEILQEANKIYVEQTDHYLSLVSASVNELIGGIQTEMTLALRLQDEHLFQIIHKTKALSEFLEYQTKKVLMLLEEHQKPIASTEVGIKKGNDFDDRNYVARGRIAKIIVRAGCIIDQVQACYEDAIGNQTFGDFHGGWGGDSHVINLTPQEKITEIDIGTGAYDGTEWEGIEELTFYTNEGKKYGPYGGRGYKQGLDWLKYHDRLRLLKIQTVKFGPDYFLGAITGRSHQYVSAISFIFFKNFAPLLQHDLTTRMSGVLQLAKEHPECKLTDEEESKIRNSFVQMMYVDLSQKEKDPYKVLGLPPLAKAREIRQAYHQLSLQYHPDRVPVEEKWKLPLYTLKFHEIKQAYDSLIQGAPKEEECTPDALQVSLT